MISENVTRMIGEKTTVKTLQNLLDYEARNFISAEVQLKKIIPVWIARCNSLQLKTVLQTYLGFVENNLEDIETFIGEEGINSVTLHNKVMEAYIEEAGEKLKICEGSAVKAACLLSSVQKINHFKISAYGTAAAFSNAIGLTKAAGIFHKAESHEKQIDEKLSAVAEHEINIEAKSPVYLPA